MTILYATTNPGKFAEASKHFAAHGLTIVSPSDLGITKVIEEPGNTLEENAILKAEAYLPHTPKGTLIIGDDTGIEIEALGGEPGVRVRRWIGRPMTDQELVDYTLKRLKNVPRSRRRAQFRTVLALAVHGQPTLTVAGTLMGEILTQPVGHRREGMPFWQIFYIPAINMTLGQYHKKPIAYQLAHPTHRELAIQALLPYLSKAQNQAH